MEKGHIGVRELLLISLLVVGLAAAVIYMNSNAPIERDQYADKVQNTTPQESPPVPESNVTNKSINQLLDEGLIRAEKRFNAVAEDVIWNPESYKWTIRGYDDLPDSVPIKENDLRVSGVRFNDRYYDGLRGFSLRTYSADQLAAPPRFYVTVIFISEKTPLDGVSEVTIDYDDHPQLAQILEGCKLLEARSYQTPSGTPVKIFDLQCKIMYGANP